MYHIGASLVRLQFPHIDDLDVQSLGVRRKRKLHAVIINHNEDLLDQVRRLKQYIDKLSKELNVQASVATDDASSNEAGKQKLVSSLQECIVIMKDYPESVEILTRMIENAKK